MTTSKSILLVEDDEELAQLVQEYLSYQGFDVDVIDNGILATRAIVDKQPDLVILDLMLPGKDGITICRECRSDFKGPIMMLTASDEPIDQVVGLEIGADDYVNKPIEPRILLARIRALLRRAESAAEETAVSSKKSDSNYIVCGRLSVNLSSRNIHIDNKIFNLNSQEFDLMVILAENAGKVLSRDFLFQAMKGFEYDGLNRFIDILISQIRQKIQDNDSTIIKTVRGKGYLLVK